MVDFTLCFLDVIVVSSQSFGGNDELWILIDVESIASISSTGASLSVDKNIPLDVKIYIHFFLHFYWEKVIDEQN
jgi:hypothetical protein